MQCKNAKLYRCRGAELIEGQITNLFAQVKEEEGNIMTCFSAMWPKSHDIKSSLNT